MPPIRSMTMSMFVMAVCSLLFLGGCEEQNEMEECTVNCAMVKGRITTGDGTEPLSNHNITLYWSSGTWDLGPASRKIAEGKTDERGYYSIKFRARDSQLSAGVFTIEYALEDRFIPYIARTGIFYLGTLPDLNAVLENHFLVPRKGALLTVRFKDSESIPNDVELLCFVDVPYGDVNHTDRASLGAHRPGGNGEKTFETAANQNTYIKIRRSKGDEVTETVESVYIRDTEERIFEIEY